MSRSTLAAGLSIASLVLAGAAVSLSSEGCGSDGVAATNGAGEAGTAGDDASDDAAAANGDAAGAAHDAGGDSAARDGGDGGTRDSGCPSPKTAPSTGETCVGFGAGTGCDTTCGLPAYGYVCFNGGPPGFTGCVQASSTNGFGDTYCCPDDTCVPQPDQDAKCPTAGKTHRYQCPPNDAGGTVAPPSGCVDGGVGGSALEHFYCCP